VSYRVVVTDVARRQIAGWGLPDPLFVNVYLRLRELESNPAARLVRTNAPFSGMSRVFSVIDPADRLTEYTFFFEIRYGQDEQTLYVVRGGFERTTGV
jgi:hypothetical protein